MERMSTRNPPLFLRLGTVTVPIIGKARMYVCGITPYDTTHLGHAATFVWSDVVARVLRHAGADVSVARNITDVDDDLLAQARAQATPWRLLATRETYRFEDDIAHLGVARPEHEPVAHNYVDEVLALAEALLAHGAAYVRDGSVLFRGEDVHRRAGVEQAVALRLLAEHGDRPDDPSKEHPLDVAVWQRSVGDEPAWESAWGPGRPGWHAECAAMSLSTLGSGLDLHAGGLDLAFPHHAYEAAMAEAATGVRPFTRAWFRPGTVTRDGKKMAKSTANLVFVHDLLEAWPPEAIRLLILDRRWDEPWEFVEDELGPMTRRVQHLQGLARQGDRRREIATVVRVLLEDLDVQRAVAMAESGDADVAAALVDVLALDLPHRPLS